MNFISLSTLVRKTLQTIRHVEYGTLRLVTPKGGLLTFIGKNPGPDAHIVLRDWRVLRRLLSRGDIALGEDYVDGKWDSENIETLIAFFLINIEHFENYAHGNAVSRIIFGIYNFIVRRNSRSGSRRNIKAHYDVGNDFYKLWLDPTMTYSSGIFGSPTVTLEDAQRAKYQRILQRIGSQAASLLEIGCGWGGFAEQASQTIKNLTCLTISPSQLEFTKRRLCDRANVLLQDYRDMRSSFDAIVSIEMFEAVGEKYWPEYFKMVARNLKQSGKAIIQTITIRDDLFASYRKRSDFIRHYVFPGGMLPSLSRFKLEAAKAGLKCSDIYTFGQDYAQTLREWILHFETRLDDIRHLGYDEGFIRNWRFYLHFCAAAFSVGRTEVAQIELVHE